MWKKIQYNIAKLFNFPFDPRGNYNIQNMIIEMKKRGGSFSFVIKRDEKGWTAECRTLKGILANGNNPNPTNEEIEEKIKDAIFTAFDVPPYLCDDSRIKMNTSRNESVLVRC